jgi:hypothetical protein
MVYNIMDNFGLIPQANVWTNTNQFKNDFSVVNGTNTPLNKFNKYIMRFKTKKWNSYKYND